MLLIFFYQTLYILSANGQIIHLFCERKKRKVWATCFCSGLGCVGTYWAAMGTYWDLIALRQVWRGSSRSPCPKKSWAVTYLLSGNCKSHIRLYYFQPQKYLPKNQGPRPLGQKENCHSTESRRGSGHSPGTDHDGVLHHDVLSAGNHTPALIHAEVTPIAGWVIYLCLLLLPPPPIDNQPQILFLPFFPNKNFKP